MAIDFNKAGQIIAQMETNLFSGPFRKDAIRDILEKVKTSDRLSALGSSGRQTNALRNQRDSLVQMLDEQEESIEIILTEVRKDQSWDSVLISRCEKCKGQVEHLRSVVRNF